MHEQEKENARLAKRTEELENENAGLINRDGSYDPEAEKTAALKEQADEYEEKLAKVRTAYDQLVIDFNVMEKRKDDELREDRQGAVSIRTHLEEELKATRLEMVAKKTGPGGRNRGWPGRTPAMAGKV